MRTKQERTNNPGKKSFEMDFKVSLQMKLFNDLDNRYNSIWKAINNLVCVHFVCCRWRMAIAKIDRKLLYE